MMILKKFGDFENFRFFRIDTPIDEKLEKIFELRVNQVEKKN